MAAQVHKGAGVKLRALGLGGACSSWATGSFPRMLLAFKNDEVFNSIQIKLADSRVGVLVPDPLSRLI